MHSNPTRQHRFTTTAVPDTVASTAFDWPPCRYGDGPPAFNDSVGAELSECLEHGSAFYDACQRKCYTEVSVLRLTQGLRLEHVVYGQLFPVLVLLVVVANVFVVLVLSQKHMITPTNMVLKYMAIADLCVGLIPLPWNFFYHTLRNSEHEENVQLWWCYMYKYSMDAVPPVCHNIAMWLTVLLAGQRYISIQYPLVSRRLCSVRNVRFATIIITAASVLCGLPKSVDYYFEVYDGWAFMEPGEWVRLRSCLSGFTVFVKAFGSNAFFNVYFWTRVFGFILLPSLLLIVLNTLLIRGIRMAKRRKDRLLKEKRAREAQRQKDSNSTSIMLVVIVTIFLVVNLPQALFMALLCVQNTFGISNGILDGDFPAAFLLVSNMLVMATYPINFGIYCFMSSSFHDTFRMFFCSKNWPRNFMARRGTLSCGGTAYNRYTVRRSDPSLQFSDINCSGCGRYSISEMMVVGNGIRASSATVTVMPFLPILTDGTSPNSKSTGATTTAVGPTTTTVSSKSDGGKLGIQRELSHTKTLESTVSNNSTDTVRSMSPSDSVGVVARNSTQNQKNTRNHAGQGIHTTIISTNTLSREIPTNILQNTAISAQSEVPPSYAETEPTLHIDYWLPPGYGNDIYIGLRGRDGEKIADIADTDEKIRNADAVYL